MFADDRVMRFQAFRNTMAPVVLLDLGASTHAGTPDEGLKTLSDFAQPAHPCGELRVNLRRRLSVAVFGKRRSRDAGAQPLRAWRA